MLGKLTDMQIEHILHSELVGRIGYCTEKKVYIVPVAYVYHNGYIYAHSQEGLKIKVMRKHPNVCFQVDAIENMANWRSVIVWGKFEELKQEQERRTGMDLIAERLRPFATSEALAPSFGQPPLVVEKGLKAVVYRIKVTEKTGRFEKTNISEFNNLKK